MMSTSVGRAADAYLTSVPLPNCASLCNYRAARKVVDWPVFPAEVDPSPGAGTGAGLAGSFAERLGKLLIEEARLLHGVRSKIKSLETELTQVIDVSYDAEDVIDTYILNEIARIAQRQRQGLVGCVKSYLTELRTRHKVGKEIQRIKQKINDISSSLLTYGIKDINDGGEETRNLNIRKRSSALYEEPDIIGMQESMITLKEQLINKEARCCVISIVGMGGKTTLTKKRLS
ncbi:disease resistance protein RPP8-like protein [Cinnamomum micranthum f. kanehirae]|uniref:Disease resistance protein RPP8-like protein n=1 Tax=Cinnamomum micranthum f. kanehirae TaxID=337451 RepID=A0A3S4NGK3_9MAGN|nr:disease resistance protein RPP8-like protein [Cinnamomum micranthum f. kanehirae]